MFRLLLLPLIVVLLAAATQVPGPTTRTFRIEPGSVLRLDGKSNVGSFSCRCEDEFPARTFTLRKNAASTHADFSATSLDVRTKSFDCGNKMMNRDMYKALNADHYPNIRLELLRVIESEHYRLADSRGQWVNLKVQMRLQLNGHSREYWIDAVARKASATAYRFQGNQALYMTAFGVKPPTPMMGAVKVHDQINIFFDLTVSVQ